MDEKIKLEIFHIIEKEINFKMIDVDIEKDLRQQISLDSMQFVSIVAQLEAHFDIELPISVIEVSTIVEFLSEIEQQLVQINDIER